MVEVVFSESACGSLKCAQSFGRGEYAGGLLGIVLEPSDGEPLEEEIAQLGWFSFREARALVTFATDEEVLLAAEAYLNGKS